jgi:hypothetical protein
LNQLTIKHTNFKRKGSKWETCTFISFPSNFRNPPINTKTTRRGKKTKGVAGNSNWVAVFQLTRGVGGISDAFHAFHVVGEQKERPTTRVSLVYLEVTLQSGFFCGHFEKQKFPQDFKILALFFYIFFS